MFSGSIGRVDNELYGRCAKKSGLCYFEPRFCPQLLANEKLSVDQVVKTVIDNVQKGSKAFDIQARLILCTMYHMPNWAMETVRLCRDYSQHGVVAIDVAG